MPKHQTKTSCKLPTRYAHASSWGTPQHNFTTSPKTCLQKSPNDNFVKGFCLLPKVSLGSNFTSKFVRMFSPPPPQKLCQIVSVPSLPIHHPNQFVNKSPGVFEEIARFLRKSPGFEEIIRFLRKSPGLLRPIHHHFP